MATTVRPGVRRRKVAPWRDRQGRISWLKSLTLAGCVAPGAVLVYWAATQQLGARPLLEAIHEMGLWTLRFFLISFALTPARLVFDWPRAPLVRRMVGVTAACYALGHLSLYVVDQNYRLLTVASEIIHRFYLTIGFVALLGLVTLAATSTDAATRWMGKWWKRLHRAVYVIGVLALLHYFIQSKANVGEPIVFAGLFLWLVLWRVLPERWKARLWVLPVLGIASALLAAGIEYTWYGVATGISPLRVVSAEWATRFGIRPAQWVLISGAAIAALAIAWRATRGLRRRTGPPTVMPRGAT
ncbi:MAG: protein-methionine-sulfoxide reductase heme-binding subunit MsrQ, partial [Acetobacteraceae bacterium]